MAEIAAKVTVRGKVQGVGYRAYVQEKAAGAHVRGWVRNAEDGSVEALLAGEALDIEKVVQEMRGGPSGAQVEDVQSAPASTDEARGCKDLVVRQ
ncbi:hypothetical protein RISW2_15370 [Roseivivax isoporae LMG 25204]|uniref:acylphosphatase n=2 Tax=Roseivivax TaxID=93682 RepID=X7F506_9RHOB|nr:hypothetical protein RISW2_15370 [Roseivivax isoporae LMG 25204]